MSHSFSALAGVFQVFGVGGKAVGQQGLIPHQDHAAPIGLQQPFVGVPAQAVGKLDAGQIPLVLFRKQGRRAKSPVHVHPEAVLAAQRGDLPQRAHAPRVGRPGRGHHGKRMALLADVCRDGRLQGG